MSTTGTAMLTIAELREFASFTPCEQRYIKRSLDIGLGRQDAFKLWARDADEIDLLRHLQARFGHVSSERVISGPGLVNIYGFLRDTGRGLMAEPKLLILDEPSLGLSPLLVEGMFGLIERIRAEEKRTIILVTNLVQQARRLADRTAFFLGGECVEIGVTEDFFTGEVKDQRTRDYVEGRFG